MKGCVENPAYQEQTLGTCPVGAAARCSVVKCGREITIPQTFQLGEQLEVSPPPISLFYV